MAAGTREGENTAVNLRTITVAVDAEVANSATTLGNLKYETFRSRVNLLESNALKALNEGRLDAAFRDMYKVVKFLDARMQSDREHSKELARHLSNALATAEGVKKKIKDRASRSAVNADTATTDETSSPFKGKEVAGSTAPLPSAPPPDDDATASVTLANLGDGYSGFASQSVPSSSSSSSSSSTGTAGHASTISSASAQVFSRGGVAGASPAGGRTVVYPKIQAYEPSPALKADIERRQRAEREAAAIKEREERAEMERLREQAMRVVRERERSEAAYRELQARQKDEAAAAAAAAAAAQLAEYRRMEAEAQAAVSAREAREAEELRRAQEQEALYAFNRGVQMGRGNVYINPFGPLPPLFCPPANNSPSLSSGSAPSGYLGSGGGTTWAGSLGPTPLALGGSMGGGGGGGGGGGRGGASTSVSGRDPLLIVKPGELRRVIVYTNMLSAFLETAQPSTDRRHEFCGILCGKEIDGALYVTTLIIPDQDSTPDTVAMTDKGEQDLCAYQIAHELIAIGWIHTHPTQTCFMSSVDVHTHCGFQSQLAEAIAIVMAPSQEINFGIFQLTVPSGLKCVQQCTKRGFHEHPSHVIVYEQATHVLLAEDQLSLVDLRHGESVRYI